MYWRGVTSNKALPEATSTSVESVIMMRNVG